MCEGLQDGGQKRVTDTRLLIRERNSLACKEVAIFSKLLTRGKKRCKGCAVVTKRSRSGEKVSLTKSLLSGGKGRKKNRDREKKLTENHRNFSLGVMGPEEELKEGLAGGTGRVQEQTMPGCPWMVCWAGNLIGQDLFVKESLPPSGVALKRGGPGVLNSNQILQKSKRFNWGKIRKNEGRLHTLMRTHITGELR